MPSCEDEFCLLLKHCDGPQLGVLADRLQEAMRTRAPVSLSLGFAVRAQDEALTETIDRADKDMIRRRAEVRGMKAMHGASSSSAGDQGRGGTMTPATGSSRIRFTVRSRAQK
jgi:GGDEF domain-containing protein